MLRYALLLVCVLFVAGCSDDKTGVGGTCAVNADCASELCHRQTCVPSTAASVGTKCKADHECKSFRCRPGVCATGIAETGQPCRFNQECLSGLCSADVCSAPLVEAGGGGGADAGAGDALR